MENSKEDKNESLKEKLDNLKYRFAEEKFLTNKGLSNEVGIYYACYPPKEEMLVRSYIEKLATDKNEKFNIINYDLYEVFLEILKDKRVLDKVEQLEEKKGKDNLLKQLQKIATPIAFVEKMNYEPHNLGDIIVITGVGKVFPYMRSHNLLESIQVYFSDIPVVVFYPGKYDGVSPSLFGQFSDGHYYRAFNLL